MRTLFTFAALGLITTGCADKSDDDTGATPTPDDTAADDTGSPSGDDTGDSGDTGGGDDTGGAVDPDLRFNLGGDYDGMTLSLTWVDLVAGDFQAGDFGDVLASAEVTGAAVELYVDPPPSEQLVEVDPKYAPGFYMAAYFPTLHDDADGDGERSGDEVYAGAGLIWPLYVSGELPAEFEALGVTEGWNALELDLNSENFLPSDPLSIPLETNLLVLEEIGIQGTYEGSDPGDLGLVLAPFALLEGDTSLTPLYDEPLSTGGWSIALGPPPEEHITFNVEFSSEVAVEIPLAYQDRDSSGSYSVDETLYPACTDEGTLLMTWFPGPTEAHLAFFYSAFGLHVGWNGMLLDESDEPIFVDESGLQDLVIGPDCSF